MKKILFVFILAMIIATGTALADHPDDQLGIGVMAGYHGGWGYDGWGHTALSLKIPRIPIFWAANLGFGLDHFYLSVSGDRYFFEGDLVSEANLHWFGGLGGWFTVSNAGERLGLSLGARLPIGISWHPLEVLEIFLDIVPSLGFHVIPGFDFPAGGWPVELGVRLWF